jgi:hypothetical protein
LDRQSRNPGDFRFERIKKMAIKSPKAALACLIYWHTYPRTVRSGRLYNPFSARRVCPTKPDSTDRDAIMDGPDSMIIW